LLDKTKEIKMLHGMFMTVVAACTVIAMLSAVAMGVLAMSYVIGAVVCAMK